MHVCPNWRTSRPPRMYSAKNLTIPGHANLKSGPLHRATRIHLCLYGRMPRKVVWDTKLSGPRAWAANATATAESIPPLIPTTTTCALLFFTSFLMKRIILEQTCSLEISINNQNEEKNYAGSDVSSS